MAKKVRKFDRLSDLKSLLKDQETYKINGFEPPNSDSVIVNRKTKSLSNYLQLSGRAKRPLPEDHTDFINDEMSRP